MYRYMHTPNMNIYIYEACAWTPNNVFLSMIVVESLSCKLECYQYPDHQRAMLCYCYRDIT